jgi:hypothetical protein
MLLSWRRGGEIVKVRSFLYRLARFLGDVEAVEKGQIGKRMTRRVIGKMIGRKIMRKI